MKLLIKKFLSVVITLCMMVGMLPGAASATTGETFAITEITVNIDWSRLPDVVIGESIPVNKVYDEDDTYTGPFDFEAENAYIWQEGWMSRPKGESNWTVVYYDGSDISSSNHCNAVFDDECEYAYALVFWPKSNYSFDSENLTVNSDCDSVETPVVESSGVGILFPLGAVEEIQQSTPHIHDNITFEAWTATDSLPTESGNYYLANDVTLSDFHYVPENVSINLCLNDRVISVTNHASYMGVLLGTELTIYDCGTTVRSYSKGSSYNEWALDEEFDETETTMLTTGGVITGMTYNGGILNAGKLTINGGNIVGCGGGAGYYGAVHNAESGTLIINGGSLLGNSSVPAVTNEGTATLNDCVIAYNNEGGIENKGTFTMNGGTIKNNNETAVINKGTFTMNGGSVIDNKKDGGIVNENNCTFTINGSVNISGNQEASGQYNSSTEQYDYTYYDADILIYSPLTLGEDFENAAESKIAVSTDRPENAEVYSIITCAAGKASTYINELRYLQAYPYDYYDTTYYMYTEGDNIVVSDVPQPHTHDEVTFTEWTAASGNLASGNYYLAESNAAALTDDIIIPEEATVTLCLDGKTLDIGSNYIDVKDGAEFNICDCQGDSGKITGTHSYQTIFNRGAGSVNVFGGTVADTNGGGIRNYSTGSVTVKGGTVTGTTYGIKNVDGTLTVTGGTITGDEYGIGDKGTVYLSGNPTVSGNDTSYADLYLENGKIYAESSDSTSVYTGDILTIKLQTPAIGDVVVNNVTTANKDKFTVTNSGYYLKLVGDDLVLTDELPHTHDNVTFEPWTATDSLPTTAGNYYLANNVTLSSQYVAPDGETSICLNGHTITQERNQAAVSVHSGATLSIYDCGTGGKITHAEGAKGQGVYVSGGTLNLHSGAIAGNKDDNIGAGVYMDNGIFNMSGGSITDNEEKYSGGGVFIAGGEFNMTGGEITGNKAEDCGGICYSSGTITVSGKVVISGNYKSDGTTPSNLQFVRGKTLTVGTLASGSEIGVTTYATPTTATPVVFTANAIDESNRDTYKAYFTSDNSAYTIDYNASGKMQLTAPPAHTHDNVTFIEWKATDSLPTESGNYYLANEVTLADSWELINGQTINLCLNDKVVTASDDHDNIWLSGASLTIYDCGITLRSYSQEYDWDFWRLDDTFDETETAKRTTGGVITGMRGNGAIQNNGTLTINGGNIVGCGGGNYNSALQNADNGTLTINGGSILGNSRTGNGGGICNWGELTINGGVIAHNYAEDYGGGVSNESTGTVTMTGGCIAYNFANVSGAGLYNSSGGTVSLSGGVIHSNINYLSENINLEKNNGTFTDFLADGYAFYDEDGEYLNEADISSAAYITVDEAPEEYKIYVGGVQINAANASDVLGDGTVFYDAEDKVLTLKNAQITGTTIDEVLPHYTVGILSEEEIEIVFIGNNEVTGTVAIYCAENLTITGNDSDALLEICGSVGTMLFKGLNIKGSGELSVVSDSMLDGMSLGLGVIGATTVSGDIKVTAENIYDGDEAGQTLAFYATSDISTEGHSITNKEGEELSWDSESASFVNDSGTVSMSVVIAPAHIHDNLTFTEWTETASLPTKAGNYVLTDDITMEADWSVKEDVSLCLNGYTIDMGENKIAFSGDALKIYNCSETTGNITGTGEGELIDIMSYDLYLYDNVKVSGKEYGIWTSNGTVYLDGAPIVEGTTASIYIGGFIQSEIDAENYTGESFSIYMSSGVADKFISGGRAVVINCDNTKAGKFTFANEGYILKASEGSLILAVKPHDHADGTVFEKKWTATGGTISTSGNYYLADNLTATSNITIDSGADVTLCLNGKTLDMGSYYIENNGTLTILDCAETEGKITSSGAYTIYNRYFAPKTTGSDYAVLNITGGTIESTGTGMETTGIYNNGGTVYVTGGEIVSSGTYTSASAIKNAGTVEMSGGTITSVRRGIYNYDENATFTLKGGSVTTSGSYAVYNYGEFVMEDGLVKTTNTGGYGIYNVNELAKATVKGGEVNSEYYGILCNGKVTVSGGTVKGNYGIYNYPNCTVEISDDAEIIGASTDDDDYAIYNRGILTVSGGKVTGRKAVYVASTGTITVEAAALIEGTGTGRYDYGIENGGTAEIKGGTIKGAKAICNSYDGSTDITGGNIIGTMTGVEIYEGPVSISGGNISGPLGVDNGGDLTVLTGAVIEGGIFNYCGDLDLKGGKVTSNDDYTIDNYDGAVYISGTPEITGKVGEIKHEYGIYNHIYGSDISGTLFYEGDDEIRIALYDDSQYMVGNAVVRGYNDANKDKFVLVGNDDYKFDEGTAIDEDTNTPYDALVVALAHEHVWSTAWSSDGTAHWHECTASGCDITENTKKDGYETHSEPDDDNDCTTDIKCAACGYVFAEGNASHSFTTTASTTEASAETCIANKFMYAKCDNCDAVSDSVKVEVANTILSHNYTYSKTSGNVIAESCDKGCGHIATATLTAPTQNLVYNGSSHNADVSYDAGWAGGALAITYTKGGSSTADTIFAGSYEAGVTIGGASASVNYTIEKQTVTEPTIDSKTYTEETLVADVSDTALYTVSQNNGGLNVGSYDVVLTLTDSNNYKWSSTDDAAVTLEFTIAKAVNEFTTLPAISGWTYGETPSVPAGEAAFGEVVFKYYDSGKNELGVTAPVNAGNYYIKAFVVAGTPLTRTATDNYDAISSDFIAFTIAKAQVQKPAEIGTTFTYNGAEQTYAIAESSLYTVTDNKRTNAGEYYVGVTLNDTDNYEWNDGETGQLTYLFSIDPLDISGAEITLGDTLTYNGSEQTQTVASAMIDSLPVTFDVSGNTGTAVADYTLTITGNGNFAGTENKGWSIAKALPVIETNPTASRVRKNNALSTSTLTGGVAKGVGDSELTGAFAWKDGAEMLDTKGTVQKTVVFTPNDTNYSAVEFDVDVEVYTISGGGGTIRYTIKFETNGESTMSAKTVLTNTVLDEPAEPTRDGFTFGGWYTDEELTEEYDFDSKVTKSFTLYAKWIENEKEPDENDDTNTKKWNPFIDVSENNWFYTAVQDAYLAELITGTSENTFSPNGNITRGMFVTILWRAEGKPEETQKATFKDVEKGLYYEKAVDWGSKNGIILGFSEFEYAPDKEITREQMAAILFRYATFKGIDTMTLAENLGHFKDNGSVSEYAVSALNWAVGTDIISGKGNGVLDPLKNATRAEATAMLIRFIEKNMK